jgi:hypothetical protein
MTPKALPSESAGTHPPPLPCNRWTSAVRFEPLGFYKITPDPQ